MGYSGEVQSQKQQPCAATAEDALEESEGAAEERAARGLAAASADIGSDEDEAPAAAEAGSACNDKQGEPELAGPTEACEQVAEAMAVQEVPMAASADNTDMQVCHPSEAEHSGEAFAGTQEDQLGWLAALRELCCARR